MRSTVLGPLVAGLVASSALMIWLGPQADIFPPLYRYNTSLSVPTGPYVWSSKWPPRRGDIVMLRDPDGFRLRWLLKRVEGVGGDTFCWDPKERRHYVNHRPMPPIPPEAVRAGLPVWRGCRVLEADEVVGFGDHHLAYGSQYLGPIRWDRLWGVYRRWWDADRDGGGEAVRNQVEPFSTPR